VAFSATFAAALLSTALRALLVFVVQINGGDGD